MDTDDDRAPPRTHDPSVTPEQRARELLDRMDVEGALDMTAGDVVELANLIAEHDRLATSATAVIEQCAAICDGIAEHYGEDGGHVADHCALEIRASQKILPGADLDDVMPARPERWSFAMDFLGDPEAPQIEAYVEALEAHARRLEAQLNKEP